MSNVYKYMYINICIYRHFTISNFIIFLRQRKFKIPLSSKTLLHVINLPAIFNIDIINLLVYHKNKDTLANI